MVHQWEAETFYELGTVVEYQGHRYKIIQAHTSQANWTPSNVPALWAKLPDSNHHHPPEYGLPPHRAEISRGGSFGEDEQPWPDLLPQKVEVHHEEKQKTHWYDLDEKHKKDLGIVGGTAAGLGLLAAGVYAYHAHEKKEEKHEALDEGFQKWLEDAQARTQEFYQRGPKDCVAWVLTNGKNIPRAAIPGGEEKGSPVYIARLFVDGGIQLGKAGSQFQQGAVVGYKHKEIQAQVYEILIGDPHAVKWVNAHGHLKPTGLGCRLVEGGYENDGSNLYIAQARHKHCVCVGKASEGLDGAYLPYDGEEKREKTYRVLAYA